MSLVLSIKENDSFYVGGIKCLVHKISGPTNFKLTVHNAPGSIGPTTHDISANESTEIMSNVMVCASKRFDRNREGTEVQVAVDAPPNVTILREKLYRKQCKSRGEKRRR